jgi:hypothetical protein
VDPDGAATLMGVSMAIGVVKFHLRGRVACSR